MRKIIFLALAFSSCTTPTQQPVKICPVLVDYPPSFERAAAQQLKALPDNSPLVVMITDYLNLRQEVKSCVRN